MRTKPFKKSKTTQYKKNMIKKYGDKDGKIISESFKTTLENNEDYIIDTIKERGYPQNVTEEIYFYYRDKATCKYCLDERKCKIKTCNTCNSFRFIFVLDNSNKTNY